MDVYSAYALQMQGFSTSGMEKTLEVLIKGFALILSCGQGFFLACWV